MSESAVPFSVSVQADDGVVIAAVAGELDLATGPIVKDNLRPFVGRRTRVVYELEQVDFIDSVGLESLFEAVENDAVENDESIVFRNPSWSVRRIIGLLDISVRVEETLSDTSSSLDADSGLADS